MSTHNNSYGSYRRAWDLFLVQLKVLIILYQLFYLLTKIVLLV